jgi:hypothetical protein
VAQGVGPEFKPQYKKRKAGRKEGKVRGDTEDIKWLGTSKVKPPGGCWTLGSDAQRQGLDTDKSGQQVSFFFFFQYWGLNSGS